MCSPNSGGTSMDLNLSLGPPRPPGLDLGFDLALGSASASASSSPLTEESRAPLPAATAMAEPPRLFPHPPYSPSCGAFADPTDHPPPISTGGAGTARDYAPYSPSYQSLGPPYAPITAPHPPAAAAAAPSRRHGALYSSSYVRVFPTDRDSDRGFDGDGGRVGLHLPYDPRFPQAGPVVEAVVGSGGEGGALTLPYLRYTPSSYVSLSMIPEDQEDAAYGQRPIFLGSPDVFVRDNDGSSSRHGLVDAELRLRRLFALQHLPREGGPSPLPDPYGDELPRTSAGADPLGRHEREPLSSEASAEITGKSKADSEGITDKDLEKDNDGRNACAVNFECNICLELAKDPVVTPCGHLFCWPCLYQWLHLHCHYNECPVCKGEVLEFEITPIYGRGSSQSRLEEEEDGKLGLKIPPRPGGRRLESWRQRIRRPILRRFGLEVPNSWRLPSADLHFGSRIDVHGDLNLQQIVGVEGTLIAHGFDDSWDRSLLDELESLDRSDGLVAVDVGPSTILGRTDSNANPTGASVPLLDNRNSGGSVPRPPVVLSRSMGQASASSTMAVIQGDVGVADAAAEPNSAGSSRNPRIRGRSSSSLYADGCPIHACKRRRLN